MPSPIRVLAMVVLIAATVILTVIWPSLTRRVREWSDAPGELKKAQNQNARLTRDSMECQDRFQFNTALIEDLITSRIRLVDAVAQLIQVNGHVAGYLDSIRCFHPAGTLEESVARNLLLRVHVALLGDPSRRAEVMARLNKEYTAAFGSPPPPDRRMTIP